MRQAQIASVTALALLGMIGMCLIFAEQGFTTSSKRAHWSIFVPLPQAYIMAGIMFALSSIAVLWLLQQAKANLLGYLVTIVAYVLASIFITEFLIEWL